MDRYNTDKKYRKAVDDALTKGPSQKSLAMQKDLRKNPNLTVDQLVKRQTVDTSKLNTLIKKTESDLTKQKPQEDYLRKILVNKLIYDGEDSLDQSEIKYLHDTKPRPYPTQASPQQMDYLKKTLGKMQYANKPIYKKGEAKIIIDELKRQQRKANPILKSEPLKINTSIPPLPVPSKEDPRLKELEARVMENKRKNEFEKTRGIANLVIKP